MISMVTKIVRYVESTMSVSLNTTCKCGGDWVKLIKLLSEVAFDSRIVSVPDFTLTLSKCWLHANQR